MKPFVTGSHAYGYPGDKSDVDLVCCLSKTDYLKLFDASDNRDKLGELAEYEGADIQRCLYFGNLNIIVCKNKEEYKFWKDGTDRLKKAGPVTRSEAIAFFARLREE